MAQKVYPAGPISPHGWYHLTKGTKPSMWLDSYDESIRFHLLGGLAPPHHDRYASPQAVALTSLKGLIPPWRHIQQKGATQDGITHIDALLDPIEVEMGVQCLGRGWRGKAAATRDLIASLDAKQQSQLTFLHPDSGQWWADLRWFQGAPQDALDIVHRGQPLSLRLQADMGCWRTHDSTSMVTGSGGWLKFTNPGDQPMYWDATLFGPFDNVKIHNGWGTNEYVEFGPLLANQIVFLRTDPRSNTTLVQDLTVTPIVAQELTIFQEAVKHLLTFFTTTDSAFANQISSLFGIRTPQGNLYRYLRGRFSDNVAIPPKSPGASAKPYQVLVHISGGSSATKVIGSGVPLRRWPL